MATKKPTTELPDPLEEGILVRLRPGEGDLGTYVLMSVEPAADGSLLLYGGDADPGGHRRYRSVMPKRLQREDRRNILAKRNREATE